jgi:uncharacterized protein (TIGR03435 family)
VTLCIAPVSSHATLLSGIGNAYTNKSDVRATKPKEDGQKLSDVLKLPVADLTETKALFDFKLEWSPDEMKAKPAELPSGPSIFAALQEQLGLRLEPRKIAAESAGDRSRGTSV